jgi:RecB family exonuclease
MATSKKQKKAKRIKIRVEVPKVTKSKISKAPEDFPVPHFSPSSMKLMSTNPILFKIKYINRDSIDTASGAGAVLGQAFHKAMEVYYGGSDTLVPVNEAEAIEYGLKAGMDFIDKYNDGFIRWTTNIPNKTKLFELLSFTFNAYVKERRYQPDTLIATEDEIKEAIDIEWKGNRITLPVKLKGYIDKVADEEGNLKIYDYKTCHAFSNPEKIDGGKIIQAVVYYLLAYAKHGEAPYSMIFEEVKYTKNSVKLGSQYHCQKPPLCASTILPRLRLLAHISTPTSAKPMAIS